MRVQDFYETIYNKTPAHMDDIHAAIVDNPDLHVITETGGERRKPNTIGPNDILRMKKQRSFFPMFPPAKKDNRCFFSFCSHRCKAKFFGESGRFRPREGCSLSARAEAFEYT
jgi:hypothetical protein